MKHVTLMDSSHFIRTASSSIFFFGIDKASYLKILALNERFEIKKTTINDGWFSSNKDWVDVEYSISQYKQSEMIAYFESIGIIETHAGKIKFVTSNIEKLKTLDSLFVKGMSSRNTPNRFDCKEFIDGGFSFNDIRGYLSTLNAKVKPTPKKEVEEVEEPKNILANKIIDVWNIEAKKKNTKIVRKRSSALIKKINTRLKEFDESEFYDMFKITLSNAYILKQSWFGGLPWLVNSENRFQNALNDWMASFNEGKKSKFAEKDVNGEIDELEQIMNGG